MSGVPLALSEPRAGVPERVRDGVWCLPLRFPDGSGRLTLSYAIEASDGSLAVIDPGWDAEEEFSAALAAFGRSPLDVSLVIVTHLHVDHFHDAVLLHAAGARLAMHPAERAALATRNIDTDAETLDRWGVPRELQDELVAGSALGRVADPLPLEVAAEDGALLPIAGRRVSVVHTPGHTPGHICLHLPDEDLLLTGDHVMPVEQPGLGLGGPTATNPLEDYVASLERIARVGDDGTEVAPGHGFRFRGLRERCAAQALHQRRRGEAVRDALDRLDRPTLWEVASALPWRRGFAAFRGQRLGSALMQTEFHVRRLGRSAEIDDARHGARAARRQS